MHAWTLRLNAVCAMLISFLSVHWNETCESRLPCFCYHYLNEDVSVVCDGVQMLHMGTADGIEKFHFKC